MFLPDYAYTAGCSGQLYEYPNIYYIYNVKQSKLGGDLINSCILYTLSGVITIHALHCGESCVTNDKCTIICILSFVYLVTSTLRLPPTL